LPLRGWALFRIWDYLLRAGHAAAVPPMGRPAGVHAALARKQQLGKCRPIPRNKGVSTVW